VGDGLLVWEESEARRSRSQMATRDKEGRTSRGAIHTGLVGGEPFNRYCPKCADLGPFLPFLPLLAALCTSDIEREEKKVKLEVKQVAKRNDAKSARILAKQIVQSRKAKERLYATKAELHSMSLLLTQQLGTVPSLSTKERRAEDKIGAP